MEFLLEAHEHAPVSNGRKVARKEAIEQKKWCMSTNIFVLNAAGQILCHQRSADKERFPSYWMTHFGGHVSGDEDFESNALKEIQEELGISVAKDQLIPWRTSKIESQRLWCRDFVCFINEPAGSFKPQVSEIDQISWLNIDQICAKAELKDGQWICGVHSLKEEYACMRAVLAAALHRGIIQAPADICIWR